MNDKIRIQKLLELQKTIEVYFNELKILDQAFIHPSFTNEKRKSLNENNQRLEFLGDAVLELVVSEYLFNNFHYLPEGQMTKIRAFTVCEATLVDVARELSLGNYLILGKGEENTGGREKPSILADALEALIGAIYIDKGYDIARKFIIKNLKEKIIKAIEGDLTIDYKTELQEVLQKVDNDKILYNVTKESGPDHDKKFFVDVMWKDEILGKGIGTSKKFAEQQAAKAALKKIKVKFKYNI
ncbi:MAG: ribonuclease III [Tepidanaerobacteraceae bacterium]|nr:ribonuclease III [Thermoanaerobacterales bacterium]